MKLKGILLTSALTAMLGVGVFAGVSGNKGVAPVEKAEAAGPYTVYIVSGNSNWTSWNNKFVLGDGTNWSSPTASSRDSDFPVGDGTNFNKAKIGSTEYNFQKITISNLNSGNWLTVQKYNSSGSEWESNGYASGDYYNNPQRFFDGANSVINGTNNVIYVQEYSGSPWLNNPWNISGYYYKVKLVSNLDSSVLDVSLQKSGSYTPADPSAPAGYYFDGWFTSSACTPASAYSGTLDSDKTLYAKFTEVSYTVSVGGASPVTLSLNGSSTTEYKASITAKVGDSLTVQRNGSDYAFSPEDGSNNNYSVGGIRFAGTFDIYLKTDTAKLWAGGMPTSATSIYYVMVNGLNHGLMSNNPNNPSETQLTGVHFNASDKINILNVSNTSTYTYKNPSLNGSSVSGFSPSGSDINCSTAGYYDLYYNFSSNSLYFGESASTACVAFSNAFVAAVGGNNGVCDYDGHTNMTDLKAEWVRQYDAWVELGASNQYAQGIMTNKNKNDGDELAACVAMYDYVVGKYGSQLDGTSTSHGDFDADFMNRDPAPVGNGAQQQAAPIFETATTITTTATVVTSVIAISTAAGFLFLKKKKNF